MSTLEHAEEEAGRQYWTFPECTKCGDSMPGPSESGECTRCQVEKAAQHQLCDTSGYCALSEMFGPEAANLLQVLKKIDGCFKPVEPIKQEDL